ncbi:MAG: hypothetical protein IJV35_04730 [Neisseriaceae bacterium]|nr:hypothetical protein [Neisseriaceae bacterium]
MPFSLRAEIATIFPARPPRLTARGDTVVNGRAINNCLSACNDGRSSGYLKIKTVIASRATHGMAIPLLFR